MHFRDRDSGPDDSGPCSICGSRAFSDRLWKRTDFPEPSVPDADSFWRRTVDRYYRHTDGDIQPFFNDSADPVRPDRTEDGDVDTSILPARVLSGDADMRL